MPQGNLKTPAKKPGVAIVPVIVKKPAAKKAAATPAKSKTTAKSAAPVATKQPAEKRATIKKPGAKAAKGNGQTVLTPEQRFQMICDAAYFRAERRGFVGGDSHEDWLAAEAEIDALLGNMRTA